VRRGGQKAEFRAESRKRAQFRDQQAAEELLFPEPLFARGRNTNPNSTRCSGSILVPGEAQPRTGEPMKAHGYTELTTTELPDEMRFRVVRHYGWVEIVFGSILCIALLTSLVMFGVLVLKRHDWLGHAGIFLTVLVFASYDHYFIRWLHGRTTELRVKSDELVVTGNLGRLFLKRMSLQASKVVWLGYIHDFYSDGLTVEYDDDKAPPIICVLPGLDREQAESTADAILRRFPNIRPGFPR